MTFVGKILVVFQLVLSICFMAFAGAVFTAQTNWKVKADTAQKDLEKARGEIKVKEETLRQELATRTTERDAEKTRAEGAEAQRDKVMADLTQQKKANETLQTENSSQQAVAQIAITYPPPASSSSVLLYGFQHDLGDYLALLKRSGQAVPPAVLKAIASGRLAGRTR